MTHGMRSLLVKSLLTATLAATGCAAPSDDAPSDMGQAATAKSDPSLSALKTAFAHGLKHGDRAHAVSMGDVGRSWGFILNALDATSAPQWSEDGQGYVFSCKHYGAGTKDSTAGTPVTYQLTFAEVTTLNTTSYLNVGTGAGKTFANASLDGTGPADELVGWPEQQASTDVTENIVIRDVDGAHIIFEHILRPAADDTDTPDFSKARSMYDVAVVGGPSSLATGYTDCRRGGT